MNLRLIFGLVALLATVSLASMAQETKTVTLKGYVVDKMCAAGMAKKSDPMERAAKHTKDCALEDHCAASGYGIFSEGKYHAFDAKGNEKAKTAIEASKREKGLYYEATGSFDGETFALASLKEASPETGKKSESPKK
jgi:type 1 fimbria pilin